jgi:FG-GAP repeat
MPTPTPHLLAPICPTIRGRRLLSRQASNIHISSPTATLVAMLIALSIQCGCVESLSFTPTPPTVPALRLPMNNAYLGSVHSSDLRPKFVWEPSTAESSGEIRYELQFSTDSTFPASDVTTIETFETSYQPPTALPVSLVAPVGARYFWRVQACLRNSCSDFARPWYANVGRVASDYNGDGYSDLAIGAPLSNAIYPSGGIVYMYYGNQGATLDGEPDAQVGTVDETFPQQQFGTVICNAGDVNADGFSDLLVGIKFLDGGFSARVFLYLGAPINFDVVVDSLFQPDVGTGGYAENLAGAGDLNGDGYDDIVVQHFLYSESVSFAKVYMGAPAGAIDTSADASLSWAGRYSVVRAAGDTNGDGFGDLIVGSGEDMEKGSYAGAAYIYEGGPGKFFDEEPDAKLFGYESMEFFGESVSSAGDFNGDGYSDVMAGIRKTGESGDGRPGRAYIFSGGPGEFDIVVDLTLFGRFGNDQFGRFMDNAGDVNGDGYSDLILGGLESYLFFGGEVGVVDNVSDAKLVSGKTSVFSAGDLNGDGIEDVGVGIGSVDAIGRVELYAGDNGLGFNVSPYSTLTGPEAGDGFGISVALHP